MIKFFFFLKGYLNISNQKCQKLSKGRQSDGIVPESEHSIKRKKSRLPGNQHTYGGKSLSY